MSEPAIAEPAIDIEERRRPVPPPALVAALLLGAVMIGAAAIGGLFEPTETRYAEIAREMQASGDWLVPRLNGIMHLHKPPLSYWAAAIGMKALGGDSAGARIPAALAGVVMLIALACATRRRFATLAGNSPLAVWLLGTSVLFVGLSRSLASDPFLGAGVALFWACAPSPWALAGIGIGFLAKGPVVLVHTLLPLLVLGLWQRDRRPLGMLAPAWGWWIAAAIGLPWFIAVIAKVPGLLSYFLVHQTWERFTTTVHQRAGPPWYFVAVLIAGMLPWTPLLIAGIGNAIRTLRSAVPPPHSDAARTADQTRAALAWLFVPLVFFSFSGSKLPAYLLPCLPAAALLTASGAGSVIARRVSALLLAGLAIAGAFAGPSILAKQISLDPSHPLPLPAGLWVALAAFALASFWTLRGRLVAAAMLVVVAFVAAEIGLAPYEGPLGSPRPAIRLLASQVRPHEPVIEVGKFNSAVPFYLGRTVLLLEVPREQRLDVSSELAAVTVTADSLPVLVERHGRVWLVGPEPAVRALADRTRLRFSALTYWRRQIIGFVARPG